MLTNLGEKISPRERKGIIGRNIYIILAFLLPVIISGAVFAVRQYFPFGNRMIMIIDSWHQYYPFLAEYQRMLKEGVSVLYSWNTGGGSNFLGVIANYLGSPLYLLSCFVPSGTPWLQAFLCLTVVLRMGVAGMSTALFLRKVFGKNDLSLVAFGMAYAFCAFFMGYFWNMMWLDTVAIMPLVIAGVVGVLRDRQFALYIISLALSVMFSFYMGYMVCLFVLLFAICYTIVSFVSMKNALKNAGKMVLYTAIAFMISAAVTVPAFMALQVSDSSAELNAFPLEYTINYGYGYEGNSIVKTLSALVRTATNMLSYTRPIRVDQGLPNIACGVICLTLLMFYITSKKIKIKEKIVSISLLSFFLLSFVVNQLNYIWHGMNTPAMVYYRWSYIFSFAVIILAYRAFTLIDCVSKKNYFVTSALLTIYLGASFFLHSKKSVLITAAGVIGILIGIALYRKKKLSYTVVCVLLCLLAVADLTPTFYRALASAGFSKNDDYPQNYEEVIELSENVEVQNPTQLYRMEFLKPYTLNDGDLYNMYGISTFNSMCDSSYGDFFAEYGLAASKANNRYVYWEGTPVTNMFLSIKYLVARDGQSAYDTAYLKEVATTDECAVYENTAYLPSGYVASTDLLSYELHEKAYLPITAQNDLFSMATGIEGKVFEVIEPSKPLYGQYEDLIEEIDTFDWYYSVDLKENPVKLESTDDEIEPVYVEYTIPEDGSYYAMIYASMGKEVDIYINGEKEPSVVHNQEYSYVGAVGELKAGDTLKAELDLRNNSNNTITTYLIKLNEEMFAQGLETLRESTMTLTEKTQTGVKGTIDAKKDGLFTTSVLYTEGWEAYVDGKQVEITPVGETFVAFEMSEGEHTIELKFTPPGLKAGICLSIAGIILFVILAVYRKLRPEKEENICEEVAENGDIEEISQNKPSDDSEEQESDAQADTENL